MKFMTYYKNKGFRVLLQQFPDIELRLRMIESSGSPIKN